MEKTYNNQYCGTVPAGMVRWASGKAMSILQQDNRGYYYDDADQVAALALWKNRHKGDSYRMKAAYRQVMVWIIEYLREASSRKINAYFPDIIGLEDYHFCVGEQLTPEDVLIHQEGSVCSEEIYEKISGILLDIFLSQKKQKKERVVNAAIRDVNILILSMQGYTLEGIAFELGMEKSHVSSYRAKARQIIEEYLRTNKPP